MAKFITLGVYTAKGLGGFVSNPETDRKAATTALAAAAAFRASASDLGVNVAPVRGRVGLRSIPLDEAAAPSDPRLP